MEFNANKIEKKWKQYWAENKTYQVTTDSTKPKFYVLDMFPYPSGAGLHVGHPLGYISSDIFSRYKRLKGFNVLHPMGFDAFGLPTEQYAIQNKIHPAEATKINVARYREQLDNIGFCFDWSREVNTTDPNYYKWTQWAVVKMFEHYYDTQQNKALPIEQLISQFESQGNAKVQAATNQTHSFTANEWKEMSEKAKADILMQYRLIYRTTGYVNWCEELKAVLANDEVKDGLSERGGHPVVKRPMQQWALRTTAYAQRLLDDLDNIDWTDALKTQQRNWIGRSEGAQMFFNLKGHEEKLEIFTTRPDTIFGATFMVLAPEHDLVPKITTPEQKQEVTDYLAYTNARSDVERQSEVKKVTGAFTGAYAINPFNNEHIPIWIGEYVMKDYGTGAIMAVPSDDERDQAFANKFDLPIIDVVDKSKYPNASLHDKLGTIINSDFLNGLEVPEAIEQMFSRMETMKIGKKRINFKLRDANFSRQRYWGEPFPFKFDKEGTAHTIKRLPVELPDVEDISPSSDGKSPLARNKVWVQMDNGFTHETDTMPAVAGSSWYFLRYMDPKNDQELASAKAINYWQDVDLYVGGTEHAVSHLLYARFWHKFFFDMGIVPTNEPFKKLINQGMIQGRSLFLVLPNRKIHVQVQLADMQDRLYRNVYDTMVTESSRFEGINPDTEIVWETDEKGQQFVTLKAEVEKMSKSKYNVVNPDTLVAEYGADCFRMYEMFLGPIEMSKPWSTTGISGVSNFIRKLWSLFYDPITGKNLVTDTEPTKEELKTIHATIKKVTDDIERYSLNTCISSFMICVNELKKQNCSKAAILKDLTILLAPFAPFITEELWQILGNKTSVLEASFPISNPSYLIEDSIEYPISINGKKRGEAHFLTDAKPNEIEAKVREMELVIKWTEGQTIKKIIIVPGRMVNIVV
jgi:leucyl-tRNA synthetase